VSLLTNWVLKRRAAAVLIMVVVLLFGGIAVTQLKNELLPNTDFPLLTVSTVYPGASAGDVETQVTRPVEQIVGSAPRIKSVRSISRESFSFIIAEFEYGTDIKGTQQTLESQLRNVTLPNDLRGQRVQPSFGQFNINSQPVIYLGMRAEGNTDQSKLSDLARNTVKPALQGINGVANIEVVGDRLKEIKIVPNPQALTQRGLSANDISTALRGYNTSFPGGTQDVNGQAVPVRTAYTFASLDEIKNLIIAPSATAGAGAASGAPAGFGAASGAATAPAGAAAQGTAPAGQGTAPADPNATPGATAPAGQATAPAQQRPPLTKLSDIATVEEVVAPSTSIARVNGTDGVLFQIFKGQNANTVEVADNIIKKEKELNAQSGGAYRLDVVYDTAQQIRLSIDGLVKEGLLGAVFCILIIFLFLFSIRSTIVTAISIPTSLVVAFILLWTQNISLNIMTLGGLAIAIGRVVDDAIVVLENIYRRVQEGEPVNEAARTGTKEVAGAITSSTLTTVAVFLPLGFVGGITGQFFLPFALTVTFALLASLIVALTIIPVFATFFIRRKVGKNGKVHEEKQTWIQKLYAGTLGWSLKHRWLVLGAAAVLFFASNFLVTQVPLAFLPQSGDKLLQVSVNGAPGSSPESLINTAKQVEEELGKDSRVELRQTTIAGNSATARAQRAFGVGGDAAILVRIQKSADLQGTAKDFRDKLKPIVPQGGNITVAAVGGFSASSYSLNVQGPDAESVKKASDMIKDKLKPIVDKGQFVNLRSDVSALSTQVLVTPKPEATGGRLTTQALGFIVAGALQPSAATTVRFNNGTSQDVVIYPGIDPTKDAVDINAYVENLKKLPVVSGVPLGFVADVKVVQAQAQSTRINQRPATSISADVTTDDTGGVTREAAQLLSNIKTDPNWPAGTDFAVAGVSQQQSEAFGGLFIAVGIAIALVYIVMVITFGSLLEPFAILFSLPLATIGAFFALWVTQRAIGLPAMIGLLMLIGIVVTNAIVLLDRVIHNRERGMNRHDALMEAGNNRVRPILMTALATVLALTPLALGFSEGSIIAAELGTVVIGGLLSSTFLTLLVVPVVYSLLTGAKERLTGGKKRHDAGTPTDWKKEAHATVTTPAADSDVHDEIPAAETNKPLSEPTA
jgi:hydrophobic/amphiphilic exporter-1 (mainly G- bacteria), HAE1 family